MGAIICRRTTSGYMKPKLLTRLAYCRHLCKHYPVVNSKGSIIISIPGIPIFFAPRLTAINHIIGFPDSRNIRPHRAGEWKRPGRAFVRGRLKMACLHVLPIIPMRVFQRFDALNQVAVEKLASRTHKIKKSDFHCIGARGKVCSSTHLPHKGLGMCRNCHFLHHYHKSQAVAQANAGNVLHPDKATLLRWYAESGNNASEAARKNLPIGGASVNGNQRLQQCHNPSQKLPKRSSASITLQLTL